MSLPNESHDPIYVALASEQAALDSYLAANKQYGDAESRYFAARTPEARVVSEKMRVLADCAGSVWMDKLWDALDTVPTTTPGFEAALKVFLSRDIIDGDAELELAQGQFIHAFRLAMAKRSCRDECATEC